MSRKALKNFIVLSSIKFFFVNNYLHVLDFVFNYSLSSFYFFIINKKLFIFPVNVSSVRYWCTLFTIVKNFFIGLKRRYGKNIVLEGVEYKFFLLNGHLSINIGYSHIIDIKICKNLSVFLISSRNIIVKSFDKVLLGDFCAIIRNLRKYNLYKNKGIRFLGERKESKQRKKKK